MTADGSRSRQVMRAVAAARLTAGVLLLARPELGDAAEQPQRLLMQTIGIRDLVLGGVGLLALAGEQPQGVTWARAGLASDSADVLLALASLRMLDRRGALIATMLPIPFVAAGAWAQWRDRLSAS
jgi:hypothetical protein